MQPWWTPRETIVAIILLLAVPLTVWTLFGAPSAEWWTPMFLLASQWFIVVLANVDQISKNHASRRACDQLSYAFYIQTIVKAVFLIVFAVSFGDKTVVASQVPGLVLDKIILWQMMHSALTRRGWSTARIIVSYLLILIATALAVLIVPLIYYEWLRAQEQQRWIWWATAALLGWGTFTWIQQMWKNWRSGSLTGRDYSVLNPLCSTVGAVAWITHDLVVHRSEYLFLGVMLVRLPLHIAVTVQTFHYRRVYRRSLEAE